MKNFKCLLTCNVNDILIPGPSWAIHPHWEIITPLAKGQWKLYCPKATLFHLRGALSCLRDAVDRPAGSLDLRSTAALRQQEVFSGRASLPGARPWYNLIHDTSLTLCAFPLTQARTALMDCPLCDASCHSNFTNRDIQFVPEASFSSIVWSRWSIGQDRADRECSNVCPTKRQIATAVSLDPLSLFRRDLSRSHLFNYALKSPPSENSPVAIIAPTHATSVWEED